MEKLAYSAMLLPCSAIAASKMQPGMWEITTSMEMSGMDGMPAMLTATIVLAFACNRRPQVERTRREAGEAAIRTHDDRAGIVLAVAPRWLDNLAAALGLIAAALMLTWMAARCKAFDA